MNSRDITVYLDERWCDSLETHTGKTMEILLEEQMISLIQQLPADVQSRISQQIQEEDQVQAQEAEANRRFSVARITENGESRCYFLERGEIMFQTAQRLRRYLRGELQAPSQFYGDATPISQEEMEQHTAELLRNSPRVVGVYDIDLDAGEVYSLDSDMGWKGYRVKDISTAVYFATKRESDDWIAKRGRFNQRLAENELPNIVRPILIRGEEPLPTDLLHFDEDVEQIDHRLNFYMPTSFYPDHVFGLNIESEENGVRLNLYASYDMEQGCVCDTLEVYLVREDGPEQDFEYRLNAEEREILRSKMDSYCMEQIGISLEATRAQYLAEEHSPISEEASSQQTSPTLQM